MGKIGSSVKSKKNEELKVIKRDKGNKNAHIWYCVDSLIKTNIWRELKQIFNEISEDIKKSEVTNKVEFKDLIMYDENENSYETLINLKEHELASLYDNLGEQEKINDIVFYLDKPSEKYKKNLLINLIEEMQNERKNIRNEYLYMFEYFSIFKKQEEESKKLLPEETWSEIVRKFFEEYKYLSLKIKTNIEKNFENLFDTFSFEYMHSQNQVFKAIKNYDEIFNLPNQFFMKKDFNIIKKYNSKLINFYRIGMKAEDPYMQYLSYYHILEYHYYRNLKNKVANKLREGLEDIQNNKAEDVASNIIKTVNKGTQERTVLKSILEENVTDGIQNLKNRIAEINDNVDYRSSINFSNASSINWDESVSNIIDQITNRIYDTRNSLVHSKEDEIEKIYEPWNDEHVKELKKEIPLIRALAELIIKNTGENINLD